MPTKPRPHGSDVPDLNPAMPGTSASGTPTAITAQALARKPESIAGPPRKGLPLRSFRLEGGPTAGGGGSGWAARAQRQTRPWSRRMPPCGCHARNSAWTSLAGWCRVGAEPLCDRCHAGIHHSECSCSCPCRRTASSPSQSALSVHQGLLLSRGAAIQLFALQAGEYGGEGQGAVGMRVLVNLECLFQADDLPLSGGALVAGPRGAAVEQLAPVDTLLAVAGHRADVVGHGRLGPGDHQRTGRDAADVLVARVAELGEALDPGDRIAELGPDLAADGVATTSAIDNRTNDPTTGALRRR